jgi:drug/metabolite transporter (DMT)-like permease
MASILWGSGDFSGSVASKRMSAIGVVALSHIIGLLLLVGVATISAEALPATPDLLWGAASGLAGAVGLAALYQGLAIGKAGVVAPITSVVSVALPVAWGLFSQELPGVLVIMGIIIGFVGVVLVGGGDIRSGDARTVQLAVLSGLGFGGFYILIAQFSEGAVFYPLVAARLASATATVLLLLILRQSMKPSDGISWVTLVLAGIFDVAANVFYTLATQSGELVEAVIVASLYPAVTILLAFLIRKERFTTWQGIGILAGLVSVVLISVG